MPYRTKLPGMHVCCYHIECCCAFRVCHLLKYCHAPEATFPQSIKKSYI